MPTYRKAQAAKKQGRRISYRTRLRPSDSEATPLDIDAATTAVLRIWHRKQAKERLKLGKAYRNDENLVFTRPTDRRSILARSLRPSST